MSVVPTILTALALLAGVSGQLQQDWWQSAVIYQVYPRSFKDGNNDGMGDLRGVIDKLDHFVDAGITAIWFSPIYKSPGVDAGYDISDFRDINPQFGTMADFEELLQKAHQLGLKVVLDFVPNHSSDQHEWFLKALQGEPNYQKYYIFKDVDPANPEIPPNTWSSNFGGPAWTKTKVGGVDKWYFHQFAPEQPDLNYRNPAVVKEMKDVLTFWLGKGVDGFRVDIISALFENEEYPNENEWDERHDQPETYDMVYQWRQLLDDYSKRDGVTRIMMTESYSGPNKLFGYYGNQTHPGAHFTFNFWLITDLLRESDARDLKYIIERWLTYMPHQYTPNWVLGNHDQRRVASRFHPQRVDGFNMLAMLLPGVAVTYNGEEIGMEDGAVHYEDGDDPQGCNAGEEGYDARTRDYQRTPYQWDGTVNAGFNTGEEPWLPVSGKYLETNLQAQKAAQGKSHYKIYKQLVGLRKESNTIKFGEFETVALNSKVFALVRHLTGESTYVLLINVGEAEQKVALNYFSYLPSTLQVLIPGMESNRPEGSSVSKAEVVLQPYEAVVLQAGS